MAVDIIETLCFHVLAPFLATVNDCLFVFTSLLCLFVDPGFTLTSGRYGKPVALLQFIVDFQCCSVWLFDEREYREKGLFMFLYGCHCDIAVRLRQKYK